MRPRRTPPVHAARSTGAPRGSQRSRARTSAGARANSSLDRVAPLAEVRPALVVHRDRGPGPQQPAQLDRLPRGHRVAQRPGHREPHPAQVQQRGVDVQPVGHLAARRRTGPCPRRSTGRRRPGPPSAARSRRRAPPPAGSAAGRAAPVWRSPRWSACPGAASSVVSQARSPRAAPPRRRAPAAVVTTTPADGSSARPASSRLSAWWSWLSSTTSTGSTSAAATAGAGDLAGRRPPAEGVPPAGGVEGRVDQEPPAPHLDEHGRPADVGEPDTLHCWPAACRVMSAWLDRPVQRVVGDLLPPLLGRQQVRVPGVLLMLGTTPDL